MSTVGKNNEKYRKTYGGKETTTNISAISNNYYSYFSVSYFQCFTDFFHS